MKVLCKRRGFTLVELIIVLVIVGVLALLLFAIFARRRESDGRRHPCQTNLKKIGLGLLQYAQDNNNRFPTIVAFSPAPFVAPSTNIYGWVDILQPYIKSTQVFQCQLELSTKAGYSPTRGISTDYYLSTNVAKASLKQFTIPEITLLCGEGNDGIDAADARYNRNALPNWWRTTENSPARRHFDTANYLFVDGHVKSIKPNVIQNAARPSAGKPTFAIR